MLRYLGWGSYIVLLLLLTALTQVGGAVLLFSTLVVWSIFPSGRLGRIKAFLAHGFAFLALYTAICVLLIPPVARVNGRVPLQCFATDSAPYAALTPLTCFFNRHYVVPKVASAMKRMSVDVAEAQHGTIVTYLDGGFPFFDGFPLLPHISHRNGRDLDLSYFYIGPSGRYLAGSARSPVGYLAFEQPRPGSRQPCADATDLVTLRWDLDWLQRFFAPYMLDDSRTAELLTWLVLEGPAHGVTGLIVEPHMSERLGVHSQLIRFQGCNAARHDDHIHVDFD